MDSRKSLTSRNIVNRGSCVKMSDAKVCTKWHISKFSKKENCFLVGSRFRRKSPSQWVNHQKSARRWCLSFPCSWYVCCVVVT